MANRPRLPQLTDFSAAYFVSIIPPPNNTSSHVTSALILLHGLGDTEVPYKKLAESLALPSTVGIVLRAPNPIPPLFTGSDAPSFHWSDDLLIDEKNYSLDYDGGFTQAFGLIEDIVEVLYRHCSFEERDIWFLGFGQGAMVALGWVSKAEREAKKDHGGFGGVVAIGSGLPKETLSWKPDVASSMIKTPVLLCGGNSETQVTKSVAACLRDRFLNIQYVKWERKGDGMPRNRVEILPIMQFFARRLRSRAGIPVDAIEL